jgi:glycosyltransferase involved in cell wall biosynthesis
VVTSLPKLDADGVVPTSTRPIRILHIFGVMNRGGAEMRTLEMMRHIDRQRFQFEFCAASARPGELDEQIRALGGKVHYVKWSLSFPFHFRALLKRGNYDVVHSHVHHSSGEILRTAASVGVPGRIAHYRSTNTSYSYDQRFSAMRRVYHALMKRWVRRYATAILAVSEAAMCEAWGDNWAQNPRCRVIYSGVQLPSGDLAERRDSVRQQLEIATDERLCIHIGNATPAKNHFRLMEIYAELSKRIPRSCLALVGEIPETFREQLRQKLSACNAGGRLIFTGVRSDIADLLAAADLMIFPSLFEGLPGTVLEAAAFGLPVLASDIAPVKEIAKYLSVVEPVPLCAANSEWAALACSHLSIGRVPAARAAKEFGQSPFQLAAAIAQTTSLYEAYSRHYEGCAENSNPRQNAPASIR